MDSAEGAILRLDSVAYDELAAGMTLSIAPGDGKSNDQIIQHGGKQVLRIAGVVSQRLNGSTMDVVVEEALEGTRMGIGIMPMPGPEPLTDDSWARAPRSTSHPGL